VSKQRYTLTLPSEVYEELRIKASRRGMTIKELVRIFLKLGLMVVELEERPNSGLYIKEQLPDSEVVRETRLTII
jgi:hypothetical protein